MDSKDKDNNNNRSSILQNKFIVDISYSHIHTRVFNTILKLNICDLIEDGPKSVNELSNLTGVSKESIIRMCRFFVPHGLFIQESNGDQLDNPIFKKTTHSTLFTETGGLKYYGRLITHDVYYQCSAAIPEFLITGNNSVSKVLGEKDIWEAKKKSPDFQEIFNKCMVEVTSASEDLASAIDWSPYKQITDIGGNHGLLLQSILKLYPSIKGINFDLDNVINSPQVVQNPSITNVAGNFFESVPSSDCYILKHILHDWDDDSCIKILKNIHSSIQDGGRVFIFDLLVNPNKYKRYQMSLDIFIWNIYSGKERELYEFQHIANEAGFKIEKAFDISFDGVVILSKK